MNLTRETKILVPFLIFFLASTVMLFQYEVPEPEWSSEELANTSSGEFVQIESTGSSVHVAFMNSSSGGVIEYSTPEDGTLLRAFDLTLTGRSWRQSVVDSESGTGRYLSMASDGEEVFLAYQDSTLGSEEVVLTDEENGEWRKRQVAGVQDAGINVGMYTSVTVHESDPLVAYHSPSNGLTAALLQDGEWEKENLGSQAGWFTSSASCNGKSVLAYSGRNSTELRASVYEDGWRSFSLNRNARSGTSLTMNENCRAVYAYMNPETQNIEVLQGGDFSSVTQSQLSRLSIVRDDGYHMSFHKYGDGLYYGYGEGLDGWNTTEIGSSSGDGEYNDLTVDEAGNIHVAYDHEGSIYVAENNRGTVRLMHEVVDKLRAGSFSVLLLLIVLTSLVEFPVRESLENLSYSRIQLLLERLERTVEDEEQEKPVELK